MNPQDVIFVDNETTLRWPAPADAEVLFALVDSNRDYLGRWVPWVEHVHSAGDELRWIEECLKGRSEGTRTPTLVIHSGEIVGSVGVDYIDILRKSSEIGYFIAESHQGRGIVTRACRALLTHLFDYLGMNRAQIRAVPDNLCSIAIPERLGFTYEGIQRQAQPLRGRFYDLAIYSILASEWPTPNWGGKEAT